MTTQGTSDEARRGRMLNLRIVALILLLTVSAKAGDGLRPTPDGGFPKKEDITYQEHGYGTIFSSFFSYLKGNKQTDPSLEEGWKLHISADPADPAKIMIPVLSKLRELNVEHKFYPPEDYKEWIRKEPWQQGKFISVYPRTPGQYIKTVEELAKIIPRNANWYDPTPGDIKLVGPVTTRYGKWSGNDILQDPNNPHITENDNSNRNSGKSHPAWKESEAQLLRQWADQMERDFDAEDLRMLERWQKLQIRRRHGDGLDYLERQELSQLSEELPKRVTFFAEQAALDVRRNREGRRQAELLEWLNRNVRPDRSEQERVEETTRNRSKEKDK